MSWIVAVVHAKAIKHTSATRRRHPIRGMITGAYIALFAHQQAHAVVVAVAVTLASIEHARWIIGSERLQAQFVKQHLDVTSATGYRSRSSRDTHGSDVIRDSKVDVALNPLAGERLANNNVEVPEHLAAVNRLCPHDSRYRSTTCPVMLADAVVVDLLLRLGFFRPRYNYTRLTYSLVVWSAAV